MTRANGGFRKVNENDIAELRQAIDNLTNFVSTLTGLDYGKVIVTDADNHITTSAITSDELGALTGIVGFVETRLANLEMNVISTQENQTAGTTASPLVITATWCEITNPSGGSGNAATLGQATHIGQIKNIYVNGVGSAITMKDSGVGFCDPGTTNSFVSTFAQPDNTLYEYISVSTGASTLWSKSTI